MGLFAANPINVEAVVQTLQLKLLEIIMNRFYLPVLLT